MSDDVLLGADGERPPPEADERAGARPKKKRQSKRDQGKVDELYAIPGALRRLRDRTGLTQAQAEEKAHFPPKKISKWETGQRPNDADLRHYIKVMGFSMEDFARFQIEQLSSVHNFKDERELDLDMEDYYKRHVAEMRRLLARNCEKMDSLTSKVFDYRLRKCDRDGPDLIREIRMLKEAIEGIQRIKSKKKT
jgi:transcriptional regulator with XRE-family HTH domain